MDDDIRANNAILKVEVLNLLIKRCDDNGGSYSKDDLINVKNIYSNIIKEEVEDDESFAEAIKRQLGDN